MKALAGPSFPIIGNSSDIYFTGSRQIGLAFAVKNTYKASQRRPLTGYDVMKKPNSLKNVKISLLLLLVFLAAIISEVRYECTYSPNHVSFIENCTSAAGNITADGLRIKDKLTEVIIKFKWQSASSPMENYLCLAIEFLHPGDINLPTKSDRAPPQAILS